MKEKIKEIFKLRNIVVLLFIVSLAGNAYFFGMKWLNQERTKYANSGVIAIRNYIVKEVNEKGRVTVQDDKGQTVVLIPEAKQEK